MRWGLPWLLLKKVPLVMLIKELCGICRGGHSKLPIKDYKRANKKSVDKEIIKENDFKSRAEQSREY